MTFMFHGAEMNTLKSVLKNVTIKIYLHFLEIRLKNIVVFVIFIEVGNTKFLPTYKIEGDGFAIQKFLQLHKYLG